MTNGNIVNKVWGFCTILLDDGVSYGDYVEQLTYLLFLKMADEQSTITKRPSIIPKKYDWQSLVKLSGTDIEEQYRLILTELAKEEGLLGLIFRKSQNRIQDPAKLKRLVTLIDGETWMSLDVDVKGEIYEGLLERNAQDTKSGAGQYFTPRSLIRAMVEVMHPEPGQTVCDPACGTGGFFLATNEYLNEHHKLDVDQQLFLRNSTFQFINHIIRIAGFLKVPACCYSILRSITERKLIVLVIKNQYNLRAVFFENTALIWIIPVFSCINTIDFVYRTLTILMNNP